MKLALIFLVLTGLSLWFAAQGTPPAECRGKSLPITTYEVGMKVTRSPIPLRFGGTRLAPNFGFQTDKGFRLVVKNQDQYNEFWKQLIAPIAPGKWIPPMPEIDFSKEMLVVSAMGPRPSTGYGTVIDGACEADGQLEIFISTLDVQCGAALAVITYPADAVLMPRSDLPIVFRETQITCEELYKKFERNK